MTFYECQRCGFESKSKQTLIKHLQRKSSCPCLGETEVCRDALIADLRKRDYREDCAACEHCQRRFNSRSSMYRHRKTCKERRSNGVLFEQVEEMKKMIDHLRSELSSSAAGCGSTTTNNIHTTIHNNTQVINIIPFGKEDLSHIVEDKRFMDTCLKRRELGLLDIIKAAYFDKGRHPQHASVKITNYKLPYIDTFNGERWVKCDKDDVLDELLGTGYNTMDEHYEELVEKEALTERFTQNIVNLIHDFMGKVKERDLHEKFYEELKRRIHLMIINESRI